MEIHLIRHGQTNWNEERRAQGQSDSILTELGIEQAKALASKLKQYDYDAVYCSSSLRTRQTAQHAFSYSPNVLEKIVYLDSFREIFLGPWEGTLYDEIEQSDPESYQHFWHHPHLFRVEGAETFYDLQNRAMSQIENLAGSFHGKKVAVVSHGALIKSVLCHAQGKPVEELWTPPNMHNCAHSVIEYSKDLAANIHIYADKPFSEI